ncbi:hypothetical protein L5515_011350 [Caenorhabditis briggsae]|uniref:Uncharacterized protein n=4 Tax=Caenorhabditis TaxID=6237 RepID=A0AAE9AF82_CAEBR|nr:hypothetical protein L3Y34_004231 [Caenorhabditis briggsae]UMM28567.1 hypothetical protein L5515_011350 [Caenorhabditis briggsae]
MPLRTFAQPTATGIQLVVVMPDGNELTEKRFRCFCGICHVVTGTQLCLIWYILTSGLSLFFGMRSTCTWLIVPICVVGLGMYAFYSKRHKFLYPFLIITVVQQLVCMLMATIITIFSLCSFDTMRQIIGHTLDMAEAPSKTLALFVVCGTVSACILLSFIHVWQAIIIYTCLEYYEDEYRKLEEGYCVETSRLDATDYDDSRSRCTPDPPYQQREPRFPLV